MSPTKDHIDLVPLDHLFSSSVPARPATVEIRFLPCQPEDLPTSGPYDLPRLRPVLAAAVIGGSGPGEAQRMVLDLRHGAGREQFVLLLATARPLVVRQTRHLALACRALGTVPPAKMFDVDLGLRLLDLGRESSHPIREREPFLGEVAARRKARAGRDWYAGLVAACQRFDLNYRFAGSPDQVRMRLAALEDGDPLDPQAADAALADAEAVTGIYPALQAELEHLGLLEHFERVEIPAAWCFARMEIEGVTIDVERIQRARDATQRSLGESEQILTDLGLRRTGAAALPDGEPGLEDLVSVLDPTPSGPVDLSPVEVQRVLGEHGLGDVPGIEALISGGDTDHLRGVHPALDLITRHQRRLALLDDPVLAGRAICSDGRVRPEIDSLGATTGRLAYRRGTVVNLPKAQRPVVVPDGPDYGIGELDYHGYEIGVAAVHHRDVVLADDYNCSGDVYTRIARIITEEQVPEADRDVSDAELKLRHPALREAVKTTSLALLNGGDARTVARKLGVTTEAAEQIVARFVGRYQALASGLDATAAFLVERGYVEAVGGIKRFRSVEGVLRDWEVRQARNFAIQAGGAVVLKLLLPRLVGFLDAVGGRLLVAPHDSVVIQFRRERQDETVAGAKALMESVFSEVFPLVKIRVHVRTSCISCWTDDGGSPDSIERFARIDSSLPKLSRTPQSIVMPPVRSAVRLPAGEYDLQVVGITAPATGPGVLVHLRVATGPYLGSSVSVRYFQRHRTEQLQEAARLSNENAGFSTGMDDDLAVVHAEVRHTKSGYLEVVDERPAAPEVVRALDPWASFACKEDPA